MCRAATAISMVMLRATWAIAPCHKTDGVALTRLAR
jgi:hypothetical protein